MKPLLLMQADKWDQQGFQNAGAYMSEKLDGQRCWWDGGITRGMLKRDVPWGNTNQRGDRLSTGLWSRYGNTIFAPDWWIDKLPNVMLDGEVWAGRGNFQKARSICSRLPENALSWEDITYEVFDMPDMCILEPRYVNLADKYRKNIYDCRHLADDIYVPDGKSFRGVLHYLQNKVEQNDVLHIVEQTKLPMQTDAAVQIILDELDRITSVGGEALMLRKPDSYWVPHRIKHLAKVKKFHDAEASVIGYRIAESGKIAGLIGALIVQWGDKQFELSGMKHKERVLNTPDTMITNCEGSKIYVNKEAYDHCILNPGSLVPNGFESKMIPRGSVITFRYKDLTDDGIPKEARYWRC